LSNAGICSDREDAEELEGESRLEGDSGGSVSGVEDVPLAESFEKRALRRGLGAALGTGVGRTL